MSAIDYMPRLIRLDLTEDIPEIETYLLGFIFNRAN